MFLFSSQLFLPDLFIACLLAVGITTTVICIHFLYKKNIGSLTRVSIKIFGFITAIFVLSLLYATFIEPYIITVNEQIIYTKKDLVIKIALISDLHIRAGKGEKFLQKLVAKTNAQKPDLVLLVGDFVYDWKSDVAPLSALKNFESTYGTYAVLGNHDQGQYERLNGERISMKDTVQEIEAALQSANIMLLRNESTTFDWYSNATTRNSAIALAGIDDWWAEPNLTAALANSAAADYVILMSHNPSVVQATEAKAADLVVSGHTHAGQVRLPWFGSIKRLPTSLGKYYDQGIFTIHNKQVLAITRGVGESLLRIRFFAPPEIMVLTLQ